MSTKETVARFLAVEIFGDPDSMPGDNDDLLSSYSLDSLGVMLLVTYLQEEFHIVIPAEDVTIENFQSVSAIALYVEGRRE